MKKSKPKKANPKLLKPILVGLVVVGLLAYLLIKYLVVKPSTVALVQDTTGCTSNLVSFAATGSCGGGLVESIEYTCSQSGRGWSERNPSRCTDATVALQNALQYCGMTCPTMPPLVKPATTTTPTPTAVTKPAVQQPAITPAATPVVKQSFWQCLQSCRKTKSARSCVSLCRQ